MEESLDRLAENEDYKRVKASFHDLYEEIKERMVNAPIDQIMLLQAQAQIVKTIFNFEIVVENDRPDAE